MGIIEKGKLVYTGNTNAYLQAIRAGDMPDSPLAFFGQLMHLTDVNDGVAKDYLLANNKIYPVINRFEVSELNYHGAGFVHTYVSITGSLFHAISTHECLFNSYPWSPILEGDYFKCMFMLDMSGNNFYSTSGANLSECSFYLKLEADRIPEVGDVFGSINAHKSPKHIVISGFSPANIDCIRILAKALDTIYVGSDIVLIY